MVVWGAATAGPVLQALAALPWSDTMLALVVGPPPELGACPFAVGSVPPPSGGAGLDALAALGDLHVMVGGGPLDEELEAVMRQGRAVLAAADLAARHRLCPPQAVTAEVLESSLAGLLLRGDVLRALGRQNRRAQEGPLCASV